MPPYDCTICAQCQPIRLGCWCCFVRLMPATSGDGCLLVGLLITQQHPFLLPLLRFSKS
jgi:hypothetical protein